LPSSGNKTGFLPGALVACAAVTFVHHIHNAEFLSEYPNMPASTTRGAVYAAWLGEALIGLAGYVLLMKGWARIGLALIAIYAVVAFGGLAHYYIAPFAAHTWAMHATIWLEAVAGALLLAAVALRIRG
jgi:hypothetical protein